MIFFHIKKRYQKSKLCFHNSIIFFDNFLSLFLSPHKKSCIVSYYKEFLYFVGLRPMARANKTDVKLMIEQFYIRRKLDNNMNLYNIIFQYGWESDLIHRMLISFESILEKYYSSPSFKFCAEIWAYHLPNDKQICYVFSQSTYF